MDKINYNFGAMKKLDKTSIGYVEGWTFAPKNGNLLNVRTVKVSGEDKKVATLTISTTLAKSVMKYNFGEDFEKEQHFIECTAWGQVADRLEKFGPTAKMILGVFGEIKVQEYDKKDGSGKGKKLVMTIDSFKGVTKKQGNAEVPVDLVEEPNTGDVPF